MDKDRTIAALTAEVVFLKERILMLETERDMNLRRTVDFLNGRDPNVIRDFMETPFSYELWKLELRPGLGFEKIK
jgi:hypothetical protein